MAGGGSRYTNSAPCTTADVVPQGVWQDVMKTTIKTSKIADLFIDASLVTGLYTRSTPTRTAPTVAWPFRMLSMGSVR
jgi:hypothetical protein